MPAAPFSAGAVAHSGGSITPAWGPHQAGDLGVLITENQDASAVAFADAAGFVAFTGTPVYNGAAPTRLGAYWCRATSSAMAAPDLSAGDHIIGQIYVIRGAIADGDPTNVIQATSNTNTGTAVELDGVTTTEDNALILAAFASLEDTAGTGLITNNFKDYSSDNVALTEIGDARTAIGLGGGFGVCAGLLEVAGPTGDVVATHVTASDVPSTTPYRVGVVIALLSEPPIEWPTITDPAPLPGDFSTAREDDRRTAPSFVHTRKRPGSLPVVWCQVASQVLVIYDGTGFVPLFAGESTVEIDGDEFSFSAIPAGGWWGVPQFFSADGYRSELE